MTSIDIPSEEQHAVDQIPRPRLMHKSLMREIFGLIVFVVAAYILMQLALPRSVVHGSSMEPTFQDGQYLVISRINYLIDEPQQGDIVVFNSPEGDTDDPSLIKRVIGIPGDVVEIRETETYVNGERLDEPYINEPCTDWKCRDDRWELGSNEYFLMGDNRNHSNDSRSFGPVPGENLIGEVMFRYWPLDQFGLVQRIGIVS